MMLMMPGMGGPPPSPLPPEPKMRGRIIIGLVAVFFGFFGVLGWSLASSISSAVIAMGLVVVDSDVKKVQHQQGGIVGQIFVKNGDRVKAGDLLLKLDDTLPRTNLAQVTSQLAQLTGRRARLEAERDGRDQLKLPETYSELGPETLDIATGEQRLLDESRATRAAQKNQLRERIGQFEREIEGLEAQLVAKKREITLIADELKGVEDLYRKNLVPITRRNALERDGARLQGESGVLIANIAKSRGQITEINMQLITLDQSARTEAIKELREVEAQIAQLVERRIAGIDILQRIEVRAPARGIVHESNVHTVGGVIAPGESLMLIVPEGDKLSIELRVSPTDIDQVHLGQKAHLRLSAFNQRTTPEVWGHVTRVAADLSREPQTGMQFYVARVLIDEGELEKLRHVTMMPGMPVEAFIETSDRSAFSYFAKPLTDAWRRAFREE